MFYVTLTDFSICYREQPIFSVRAHVFQIDPETKKNWISASKTAVAVSYYYDSARHTYRIISVEGSKVVLLNHQLSYEPRHKKTCLRGFRPCKTQTGLLSYRN